MNFRQTRFQSQENYKRKRGALYGDKKPMPQRKYVFPKRVHINNKASICIRQKLQWEWVIRIIEDFKTESEETQ